MPFQVGPGIKDQMDQRGEAPVENEQYQDEPGQPYSYCASRDALYIYSKAANRVARLPFV